MGWTDLAVVKETCDLCYKMWEKGWTPGGGGNVSVILSDEDAASLGYVPGTGRTREMEGIPDNVRGLYILVTATGSAFRALKDDPEHLLGVIYVPEQGDFYEMAVGFEGGRPTGELLARLDVARDYWRANPGATLVLTGGNPDESGRTEAAVMKALLLERGVPEARMLLEDRAETTRENFVNTIRMLPPGTPVALITSDCHMDRAVRAARRAGFADVRRFPAPSNPRRLGANLLWEVVMELNELVR